MDISSPVTVTASSSFNVNRAEVLFAPELAVQADTSLVWTTCFLSNREANPWFRLEFETVTSIFNVRLSIREPPAKSGQASLSISLTDMDQLSVYVSNSSTLTNTSNTELCGNPWESSSTKAGATSSTIEISCMKDLKGRFLYVTVPSPNATHLVLCSIVLNREDGNVNAYYVAHPCVGLCMYNLNLAMLNILLVGYRILINAHLMLVFCLAVPM